MTDLWVENESEKASCISYSKSNTHCIGKPAHCKYVMYSGKPPSSWGWVTAIIMATQWNVRQVLCAGRVATQTICYQFQVTSIQVLKQKCNINNSVNLSVKHYLLYNSLPSVKSNLHSVGASHQCILHAAVGQNQLYSKTCNCVIAQQC